METKHKGLPHNKVYVRLGPSKIHGIGVLAIAPIQKGTMIFHGDEETQMVWVSESQLKGLSTELKKLYKDFCVLIMKKDKTLYGCPVNFNAMTTSWYLNHSSTPNIICNKEYIFYAKRNIKKGEELTVDYKTYSL